jgi:hypothetical protein
MTPGAVFIHGVCPNDSDLLTVLEEPLNFFVGLAKGRRDSLYEDGSPSLLDLDFSITRID